MQKLNRRSLFSALIDGVKCLSKARNMFNCLPYTEQMHTHFSNTLVKCYTLQREHREFRNTFTGYQWGQLEQTLSLSHMFIFVTEWSKWNGRRYRHSILSICMFLFIFFFRFIKTCKTRALRLVDKMKSLGLFTAIFCLFRNWYLFSIFIWREMVKVNQYFFFWFY